MLNNGYEGQSEVSLSLGTFFTIFVKVFNEIFLNDFYGTHCKFVWIITKTIQSIMIFNFLEYKAKAELTKVTNTS